MKAMLITAPHRPLAIADLPVPRPGRGQHLIKVRACGVCRTDLHVADGELTGGKLPVVPGHEIVGEVVENGAGAERFVPGTRVGVPWLGYTCGACAYCASGRENLCDHARFTGYHIDGGYAEYTVADQRYCFALPAAYNDAAAAPRIVSGLIGYRDVLMGGDGERLGVYGFGAAAHILAQVARYQKRRIFAFTRPGDEAGQRFAHKLGAAWAGDSTMQPPEALDA